MKRPSADAVLIVLGGLALGGLGAALAVWGNPANSGICISCFLENFAGSLALHDNLRMAYYRPELAGFVAGAVLAALAGRELRPRVGRLPILGFILGFFMIAGSAVFMGCPIKMMLRLGAGDLTAVAGLGGLSAGVFVGARYLKAGVDLGSPAAGSGRYQGLILPLAGIVLFLAATGVPGLLRESTTGPGAQQAPMAAALASGVVIGALAQRSRFCVTGSFTNLFLARDPGLLRGLVALFVAAMVVNLSVGSFHLGLMDQPGSNPAHIWNFLSMGLVGFAAVLAGGCPFRQLILAGEGLVDAGVVILGMVAGGALAQQWAIASTSAGPTWAGKLTVLGGLAFCLGVVRFYRSSDM